MKTFGHLQSFVGQNVAWSRLECIWMTKGGYYPMNVSLFLCQSPKGPGLVPQCLAKWLWIETVISMRSILLFYICIFRHLADALHQSSLVRDQVDLFKDTASGEHTQLLTHCDYTERISPVTFVFHCFLSAHLVQHRQPLFFAKHIVKVLQKIMCYQNKGRKTQRRM